MSDNGHFELTPGKSLFRIGEVSRLTDTKPFVLRYWETEFPMLQPVKSPKGHRLYRREDVQTVLHIKRLLYDEGFTIAGARRHLRGADGTVPEFSDLPTDLPTDEAVVAAPPQRSVEPAGAISRQALVDLRDELRAFLTLLETE
jgi:DNA-binding transcriptional MerR regulator